MSTVAELLVKIGVDVDDFEKKIGGVGQRTKDIGKNISDVGAGMTKWVTGPIALVGGSMLALASKTGDYADRILDLKEITGMSTDAIQEWQHVAGIAGVSTEAMTQASEQLTKQMSALAAGGNRQSEALADLGIAYEELEAATPDQRMEMLTKALADIEDPAKRAQIGTDLLKGSWDDIAPIVGMGADAIEEAKNQAHDMGAIMGEDALKDANDFRIEMQALKDEALAMGRNLATDIIPVLRDHLLPVIKEHIIPAIKTFVGWIADITKRFGELSPTTQKIIMGIIAFAAALGPILIVVGKVVSIIGTLISVGKVLIPIIMGISLPLIKVIAIIAALVAIGILLYRNWETIKEFAINIWNSIVDFFKQWGEYILAAILGPIFLIGYLIFKHWDEIKEFTAKIWESIKDFFVKLLGNIVDTAKKRFQMILNIVTSYMEMAKKNLMAVWDFIKNTFQNAIDFVSALVRGDFQGMRDAISNQMDNIKNLIENIWGNVMDFFKSINLYDIGRDLIRGLWNGIKSMAGNLKNNITGFISDNVPGPIKKTLGIRSPSRLMMEYGQDTGEGFALGMEDMARRIEQSSEMMANAALPDVSGHAAQSGGSVTHNYARMLEGATFHVREEADINRIAEQLERRIVRANRAQGGI